MLNIKEIALKVGLQAFEEHPYDKGHVVSPDGYTWIDDKLIEFAEALIAELAKQNKPIYAFRRKGLDDFCTCDKRRFDELSQKPALFEVQVFYRSPPTAKQIANETAEAIAKFVAFQRNDIPATGIEFAEVIRSGAWKGFKK